MTNTPDRILRVYTIVTPMGSHDDEYYLTADEAADFARSELCTEEFELVAHDIPESKFYA